MKKPLLFALAVVVVGGAGPIQGGEATVEKTVQVAGGTVRFPVPQSWQSRTRSGSGGVTTVELAPPSGDDFKVLLSFIPVRPGSEDLLKPAALRQSVERSGQRPLAQAVETVLDIKELAGPEVQGLYFSLTDKDPGDSYLYLTQGEARVGTIAAAITILQRTANLELRTAALEMVRAAVLVK